MYSYNRSSVGKLVVFIYAKGTKLVVHVEGNRKDSFHFLRNLEARGPFYFHKEQWLNLFQFLYRSTKCFRQSNVLTQQFCLLKIIVEPESIFRPKTYTDPKYLLDLNIIQNQKDENYFQTTGCFRVMVKSYELIISARKLVMH